MQEWKKRSNFECFVYNLACREDLTKEMTLPIAEWKKGFMQLISHICQKGSSIVVVVVVSVSQFSRMQGCKEAEDKSFFRRVGCEAVIRFGGEDVLAEYS